MARPTPPQEEDIAAACALVATGEGLSKAAQELGVDRKTLVKYLQDRGYVASGSTNNRRWRLATDDPPQPAILEAPVHDIDNGRDNGRNDGRDDGDDDDEVEGLYRRLDQAAQALKEANERLATFDTQAAELATLREEHAHCTEVRARLERTIAGLRNDAEFGREERKRQEVTRRRVSRELFDQHLIAVSSHLHPPKEER
jgi:hypothetical protein